MNSRDYIIEKCAPVFNRLGPKGASLSELCKATGMTKGALYANFKDKDEIAAAAFEYNARSLMKKEAELVKMKDSPHEKLMLLLDFYENAFRYEEFQYGCPVANLAPEVDDTNQKLLKAVQNIIRESVEVCRQLIEAGIEAGEYPDSADPDFAHTIISTVEGGLLIGKAMDDNAFLQGPCRLLKEKLEMWFNQAKEN